MGLAVVNKDYVRITEEEEEEAGINRCTVDVSVSSDSARGLQKVLWQHQEKRGEKIFS